MEFIKTSALERINVEELFSKIAWSVYNKYKGEVKREG